METTLNQVTALCKKLSGHEACHQLVSQLCRGRYVLWQDGVLCSCLCQPG